MISIGSISQLASGVQQAARKFKDGKFVSVKTFLDVLSQAQQITPDGPAKEGINAIVQATRLGL